MPTEKGFDESNDIYTDTMNGNDEGILDSQKKRKTTKDDNEENSSAFGILQPILPLPMQQI